MQGSRNGKEKREEEEEKERGESGRGRSDGRRGRSDGRRGGRERKGRRRKEREKAGEEQREKKEGYVYSVFLAQMLLREMLHLELCGSSELSTQDFIENCSRNSFNLC